MSKYQIYMLGGLGRIVSGIDAEHASDEEARFNAQVLLAHGECAQVRSEPRQVGFVHHLGVTTIH